MVLREAAGARERLAVRAAERAAQVEALARSELALTSVRAAHASHAATRTVAREGERTAAKALDMARATLRSAEAARKAWDAVKSADDRHRRLEAAFARLDVAEQIAADLSAAEDALATAMMTESAVERLHGLEQAVMECRSATTAGAAVMRITLAPGAPSARLNGAVVDGTAEAVVTESQTLDIAGVGLVTVEPPMGGEAAQAGLRAAEQDLAAFLAEVGYSTPFQARAAGRLRLQTEQAVQGLAARLEGACVADPELGIAAGLDALRGLLAAERRPAAAQAGEGTSAEEEPLAAWESAQEAEREAEGRRQAAVETLQAAELEEVRFAGLVDRAAADRQRLAADLEADLALLPDADLAAQLIEAQATRLNEEAEVLRLLDRVMKDAQREASRRYLAPVTQRVAPYVTRLLPNSSLAFGDDYSPQFLHRGGREEAAENLSKGTQEQLAVLTRIAFADMLIEKGKPASLVLDDALVFADDDRFETMMAILAEAAQRMQVIVLSCRTSAYRAVDAKRIIIG